MTRSVLLVAIVCTVLSAAAVLLNGCAEGVEGRVGAVMKRGEVQSVSITLARPEQHRRRPPDLRFNEGK